MLGKLISLYGEVKGKETGSRIRELINVAKTKINCENRKVWDESDIFLIAYPDSFHKNNTPTLQNLNKFLQSHLNGLINSVHILPFFPFSSDRGFSVKDFYQVKQEFGNWSDVEEIGKNYRLMVDLVLNHISIKHEWFQKFLEGNEKYREYFIHFGKDEIPHQDLKKVFRPRATPLLTPFQTAKGERWVWTTFSMEDKTDQVDLNYRNPEVLLEIIKILLFLLEKGVRLFRLDSVPYLWKEIGTDCINLSQTHLIVSVIRSVLDEVCSSGKVISQASTSFSENISYFGNGQKESHLVYNFPLPPLILDAFYNQSNKYLNQLISKMQSPNNECTFFNILAVHDGVGINGAKGFLADTDLAKLYENIKKKGGQLSYRSLPDGQKTVSELNTTWWSALAEDPEPFETQLKKFITSYAIAFSLTGIPAVYYLSLFGCENDNYLYNRTTIKRDLNRTNLEINELENKINNKKSREFEVFTAMTDLIKKRKEFPAFHPKAKQETLFLDERIFALIRSNNSHKVLALHNLSDQNLKINFESKIYELEPYRFSWNKLS